MSLPDLVNERNLVRRFRVGRRPRGFAQAGTAVALSVGKRGAQAASHSEKEE